MPAINRISYVVTAIQPELPIIVYFNTAKILDHESAVQVPTQPHADKSINDNLQGTTYYLNNDNVDTNGYVFVPRPYTIDITHSYIYDDNSSSWRPFLAYSDCFETLNETATLDGQTYNIYRYGYYDEDYEAWRNTARNINFKLIS